VTLAAIDPAAGRFRGLAGPGWPALPGQRGRAAGCPAGVAHTFGRPPPEWDPADLARNDAHRRRLQRIVDAVQPSRIMHGHLHRAYQRSCDFGYGPVQVTGLDADGRFCGVDPSARVASVGLPGRGSSTMSSTRPHVSCIDPLGPEGSARWAAREGQGMKALFALVPDRGSAVERLTLDRGSDGGGAQQLAC
jgi:hypothetical protein